MICHGWMDKQTASSQRFENATLYTIDTEAEAALSRLWPYISDLLLTHRSSGKKRVTKALQISGCNPLFIKASTLESFPSRLRTTLGLRRRSGLYDWPLEELNNHVAAQKRTNRLPRLLAYGLVQQRFGIVSEVFLSYEHLTNWIDGYQWLRMNPTRAQDFVQASLELITQLDRESIYHLDLWAGNIMIKDDDLSTLKAIDLENCFIGDNANMSATLGFQFALLYEHQTHRFINEAEYDHLVNIQLSKMPAVNLPKFRDFYEYFKHNGAHRKERYLIPKLGNIAIFL